ncbi:MAG: hypothetical protein HQL70_03550 [Magnetococcales bacterium]|nr:hypothetical protein [Magnetococcales bacterium]
MNTPPASPLANEYLAWQQRRLKEALQLFTNSHQDPYGLLVDIYLFAWLHREIQPPFRAVVLSLVLKESTPELTKIILTNSSTTTYIKELVKFRNRSDGLSVSSDEICDQWQKLNIFNHSYNESVRQIQTKQKLRSKEVGGELDQERVALVDGLPDNFASNRPFAKVGFIPHMSCPANCRHCMFVWRQPMKSLPDPAPLLKIINAETSNILFTGGDLTQHMPEFYRAIKEMGDIGLFAILLNGSIATSRTGAEALLQAIRQALKNRPKGFLAAEVILQISFDEYHQEIISDENGQLKERIPVANIANLLISSLNYPEIKLVLLHKQNRLNFSDNIVKYGVFSRLSKTLSSMGHPIASISWQTSPRVKADPVNPGVEGGVIRDVFFTLQSHPDQTIQMMSSSIDAYGRAALLDPSEYINERNYLEHVLTNGPPAGDGFDIDPMVWYDGSVTLFSATHFWIGNLYREPEKVFARYKKDPLLAAINRFDPTLLQYYSQLHNDMKSLVKRATGPHHLFHQLTESAAMRLHLTKRLIESAP